MKCNQECLPSEASSLLSLKAVTTHITEGCLKKVKLQFLFVLSIQFINISTLKKLPAGKNEVFNNTLIVIVKKNPPTI